MPHALTTTPDMETDVLGFLIWFAIIAVFGVFVWVVNRREAVRKRRALSSPRSPEVT